MKHFFSNITNIFLIAIFLLFSANIHGQKKLLTYKEKVYVKGQEKDCGDEICSRIELRTIEFVPKNKITERINQNVLGIVLLTWHQWEYPLETEINSYDDFVNNFVKEMQDTITYGSTFNYQMLEVSMDVTYQDDKLLNLCVHYDRFYKGAVHGNYGTISLFFDLKTGREISLDELITDMEGFKKLCEKAFRKKYEIPEQENINSTEFSFRDDVFQLPGTIIFLKQKIVPNKIVLQYGPYEATVWMRGWNPQVEIDMSEVDHFIKYPKW